MMDSSWKEIERPIELDSVQRGLRKLLRQGGLGPASILASPALLSLARSATDESIDDGMAATMVARAIESAVAETPSRDAVAALFGLGIPTEGQSLKDRRAAAAKIVGLTPESFRVRGEARLLKDLARALLVELTYLRETDLSDPHYRSPGAQVKSNRGEVSSRAFRAHTRIGQPSSSHRIPKNNPNDLTSRLARVATRIGQTDTGMAVGLWDLQKVTRMGEVMDAIKGVGGQPKHIKDGYQYVGGFPARTWRLATADDHYKTLSYGIESFHKRWRPISEKLTVPYHYVSIGPGTGEKDRAILNHLQSLASGESFVYVPVDISPELLRISLDVTMRDLDPRQTEVLPVELDITADNALTHLSVVLDMLRGDTPILFSLLGNTLANFDDDRSMLARIASLLTVGNDRLFLEIATTDEATERAARRAASEYEGSLSFHQFAIATLREYTNIHLGLGEVCPTGEIVDDTIKITTRFRARRSLKVDLKDGDEFRLKGGEDIILYTSRKYTDTALTSLLVAFDTIAESYTRYANSHWFGLGAMLLAPRSIIARNVITL